MTGERGVTPESTAIALIFHHSVLGTVSGDCRPRFTRGTPLGAARIFAELLHHSASLCAADAEDPLRLSTKGCLPGSRKTITNPSRSQDRCTEACRRAFWHDKIPASASSIAKAGHPRNDSRPDAHAVNAQIARQPILTRVGHDESVKSPGNPSSVDIKSTGRAREYGWGARAVPG